MDANKIIMESPLHVYEPEEENYSIYIVLSKTQTLPSNVIRMWTREPYAHTSLALDIELNEIYSFARKRLNNPFDCGFISEDITSGVFGRDLETTCRVGRLRVTKQQYEKIQMVLDSFKQEKSRYHYNYLGILGVMCHWSVERRYNYFCSQFVSTVLRKAGVQLLDKKPGLTCPRDFRTCRKLELVYEGKLRNYRNFLKLHYQRNVQTGDYIV